MKTNSPPGDFPELREEDAPPEITVHYRDLKAVLQVPFVNLVWRRIAAVPGGLDPVWTALKPAYKSGDVNRAASYLKPDFHMHDLPSHMGSSGLDASTRIEVSALLAEYEYANLINLAAFSALLVKIDKPDEKTGETDALSTHAPLARPNAPMRGLPRAFRFSELSPEMAKLVERFNGSGASAHTERRHASLPLTLAHWPQALICAADALEAMDKTGALRDRMTALNVKAGHVAGHLAAGIAPPDLTPSGRHVMRGILMPFIPESLVRMIIIIEALKPVFHPIRAT